MKKLLMSLLLVLGATGAWGMGRPPEPGQGILISELDLRGRIEGENVSFTLNLQADAPGRGRLTVVEGDVTCLTSAVPHGVELVREGKAYVLVFDRHVKDALSLTFASLPAKEGDWRATQFTLPGATVRHVAMQCDRPDLQVEFPGALGVERRKTAEGRTEIAASLGVIRSFTVRWKPEVKALTGELAATCDAHTIYSASVGVLRLDSLLTYRVIQGALEKLTLALPAELNVTQVRGQDIREWAVEPATPTNAERRLVVILSRPQEKTYQLGIEAERVLAAFPCKFDLPMPAPQNVLRTSGFLLIGTDSAVKLLVNKSLGLTQIDQAAFPAAVAADNRARLAPARAAYAYQYANLPARAELSADDIVTTLHSEERLTLSLSDNDLAFDAVVELDVRDAPAREAALLVDPTWSVVNVAGANLADYEVRDQAGTRQIKLFFKTAVSGRALVEVRLEKTLAENQAEFTAPLFRVAEARTERGHLVLRAEKGVRFKPSVVTNLTEVHLASLPTRVPDAQQAFRFKDGDWTLGAQIEKTTPAIYAELFQLVSAGESALYGSCSITYHVGGAPVRQLRVRVPAACQNVEFTGHDIRAREKTPGGTNDEWQVTFQEKILGDYTLLVTYDQPFAFEGGGVALGGLETVGTENESGYLVLAGAASLQFQSLEKADPALIKLDRAEIPPAYALLINDPVLAAFKYVGSPHRAALKVQRYATQPLLAQVADHIAYATRLSKEGESVTTVTYDVKNSSQQYFGLQLPEGARLWSAKVDGAAVQALSVPQQPGKVLVPLRRLRDPNQPLRVEVEYAESKSACCWWWPRTLRWDAPVMDAQSGFAKWTLTAPEHYTPCAAGGNLAPSTAPLAGLLRLAVNFCALIGGLVTHAFLWLVFVKLLCIAIIVFAFRRARGLQSPVFYTVAAVLLTGALGLALFGDGLQGLRAAYARKELGSVAPRQESFTRPVSPAGSALELTAMIQPAWLGQEGSLTIFAAGTLVGLVLLAGVRRRGQVRPGRAALGLTLLTWGLAAAQVTQPWLCAALLLLLPALVTVALASWAAQWGRRLAARDVARLARLAAPPPPMPEAPATSTSGFVRPGLLLVLAALTLVGSLGGAVAKTTASKDAPPPAATPPAAASELMMKTVTLTVEGPSLEKNAERMARVVAILEFHADKPGRLLALPPPHVLTSFKLDSHDLKLASEPNGYIVDIAAEGDYRVELHFLAPVRETDGVWRLELPLLPHVRNAAKLVLPAGELDVQSESAVQLKATEQKGRTEVDLVFGPVNPAVITWRPRERKTGLEKAVVFTEVNTLATFETGVINLQHAVRYQIAQGEIQSLTLRIPPEMSVTAVGAPGLSTWRYDPDKHLLEALLERPVSADFTLRVVTQVPQENLPYDVTLAVPIVENCARQRGALALAASEAVQLHVDEKESTGLAVMSVGDFAGPGGMVQAAALKRAFRYHQPPATLKAHAERVLPEVRVAEEVRVDVSDERAVLSSKLEVAVAKSGIFDLRIGLPAGYDIESLTGADVSHWDEVKDGPRAVLVHFNKQVLGTQTLNVICARPMRGIGATLEVPRLTVQGALKHVGTLLISGERGVHFTTARREGVSEINPGELGVRQQGYVAFRLLRPDWAVDLKAEALAPVVRVEALQVVAVADGLLQGRVRLNYKIENAGVKSFVLQAPQPGLALTVLGRNIARAVETDKQRGLWQVDLHGKVENDYALDVAYQQPLDVKAQGATLAPLLTVGTEQQKGWLVVMSSARLKIAPTAVPAGFKEEDARSIPAQFNAGDLSDAILCYRVTKPDAALGLTIVRHGAADALPATVQSVRLESALSGDDSLVTRAQLQLTVGDMRFLRTTLPADSAVWCVFVNGRPVPPLREGKDYLIPLDRAAALGATSIEFIYSGCGRSGLLSRTHRFEGPRFDLPLTDIAWTLYAPANRGYYGFDGTLTYRKTEDRPELVEFDDEAYTANNAGILRTNLKHAEVALKRGEEFARNGQQQEARQAFESALYYSQGKADYNEDVRLQYRNLAKQQAVVGLVNRRDELKAGNNLSVYEPAQQGQALTGNNAYNGGTIVANGALQLNSANAYANWTSDQAAQVTQNLSAKDSTSLNVVAEKILDQQAAAAGVATALRVTMPIEGRVLEFTRPLQITPGAELSVSFKTTGGGWLHTLLTLAAFAGAWFLFRVLCGLAARPARA